MTTIPAELVEKLSEYGPSVRKGVRIAAEYYEPMIAELVEALEFYADVSKYPSPFTGALAIYILIADRKRRMPSPSYPPCGRGVPWRTSRR